MDIFSGSDGIKDRLPDRDEKVSAFVVKNFAEYIEKRAFFCYNIFVIRILPKRKVI